MEPLEFLAAVLPSSGIYCVAGYTPKYKSHKYFTTLPEVQAQADHWAAALRDVYFALATFKVVGSRKTGNAALMRSLFIDIDCGAGKAYPDKKSGAQALAAFTKQLMIDKIGDPWIVDSGGGIHAYWPLDRDLTIEEWHPLAEAFKRAAHKLGFRIDMTATADASRVLRMPGTHNHKPEYLHPRPVTLRLKGGVFPVEVVTQLLDAYIVQSAPVGLKPAAPPTLNLPGTRPGAVQPAGTATGAVALALAANAETRFKDILSRTVAGTGCAQIKHYVENAQQDGMEPVWRGILSIAKSCIDGEKAAKRLSAMHPYPEARMLQKWQEIKGPYPCTKLDSENPGLCTTCPHWGKITNPLALGRTVQADVEEKAYVAPAEPELPDGPVRTITRPTPPKGFVYGQHGGVYMIKDDEDAEGVKITRNILLVPYDLFVVDVLHENGAHLAHLVAMRPDGAHDATLNLKAIVSKDETVKALAEQNIIAAFGSGNDKNLAEYVRAAITEASLQRKATVLPTQYGWQTDSSFVLHSTIYYPDGSLRKTPSTGLENLHKATRPAGTLEGWKKVMNLLMVRGLTAHLAHACIGFGSPLMQFTGYRGMTFHAGHKESGTGKSLALSLAASIWGNPTDYRTGKQTSPVAMQQRSGNLNSLPFLCDELTMKARGDMEWFPAFTFDFSEGRGKERMEGAVNRERINTTTWCSLAFFTSNIYMLDYMAGSRVHSSEGEIRRFLDWQPSTPLQWNAAELDTLRTLGANYGTAGPIYAQWLVQNQDTARALTRKIMDKLFVEYNATNDERYWIAGCAAVLTGATLAGTNYAGIIDLPVREMVDVFRKMIEKSRAALRANYRTAEDVLNEYTREFYGQFVVIRKIDGVVLAELGNGGVIDQTISRSKVAGRVEHGITPGHVDYYIEEALLKRHCTTMSYGYQEFLAEIEKLFYVTRGRKDLLQHTKGPNLRAYCVKISRRIDESASQVSVAPS